MTSATTGEATTPAHDDRWAVVDVAVRYATALDTRDWSLLRRCFTDDVVTHYGDGRPQEGYEAFEATCRAWLPDTVRSQHLLGNSVVELEGDTAVASHYVRADHVHEALPGCNLVFVGQYHDRLRRTPHGWRIHHRRFEVWWTQGEHEVLRPA
jgi:ketosteroid isomerase-like protein